MNTLNRRAARRAWPLTKLNLPVKITGGGRGDRAPRPLPILRHCNVFATSRFRYIEVLFHISRLWLKSRKSFTEDFVILVQYSNKFMHGLVNFSLFCFVLYCYAFVQYLMWRQYNTMPFINLSEYWKTLLNRGYTVRWLCSHFSVLLTLCCSVVCLFQVISKWVAVTETRFKPTCEQV